MKCNNEGLYHSKVAVANRIGESEMIRLNQVFLRQMEQVLRVMLVIATMILFN